MKRINLTKKDIINSIYMQIGFSKKTTKPVFHWPRYCKSELLVRLYISKKYLSNFERVESKMLDVSERDKMKAFQSPVRGKEIMKILNLSPGKTIGKIKSRIEEAILDWKIENSYEEAIEYLSKIKSQFTQNQSRLKWKKL